MVCGDYGVLAGVWGYVLFYREEGVWDCVSCAGGGMKIMMRGRDGMKMMPRGAVGVGGIMLIREVRRYSGGRNVFLLYAFTGRRGEQVFRFV